MPPQFNRPSGMPAHSASNAGGRHERAIEQHPGNSESMAHPDHPAERDEAKQEQRLVPEEALCLVDVVADQELQGPKVRDSRHLTAQAGKQLAVGRHLVGQESGWPDQEKCAGRGVSPPGPALTHAAPRSFSPDLPAREQTEQRGDGEILHVQPGEETRDQTEEHPRYGRSWFRWACLVSPHAVPQPDGRAPRSRHPRGDPRRPVQSPGVSPGRAVRLR